MQVDIFADADYAREAQYMSSVSEGVVLCGLLAVKWFYKTHKCVTLSTRKHRVLQWMADAVTEGIFMSHVWCFVGPEYDVPCMQFFEDSQGAEHLAKNTVGTSSSKHINICHHFLREVFFQGDISVQHVVSEYQHVGLLTKPLTRGLLVFHSDFLMNLDERQVSGVKKKRND